MRILIVEDEYLIRKGLLEMIGGFGGIQVVGASENGVYAKQIIAGEHPDLVLADIRMPEMDGLELAEWIHKEYPEVVVILLTGYDDFKYVQKALKLNVFEYVLKPVNDNDLKLVLKKAGEEAKLRQHRKYQDQLVKVHTEGKVSLLYAMVVSNEFLTAIRAGDYTVFERLRDFMLDYMKGMEIHEYSYAQLIQGIYNTILQFFPETEEMEPVDFTACKNIAQINIKLQKWIYALIDKVQSRQAGHAQADKMKEYIFKHYQEDITLQILSEEFGLTAGYISEIFKEAGDKNFHEFLTEVRIGKAIELLKDKRKKISEIAEQIGYHDTNYFFKVFKKTTGMTPKQFREQL